jgi:DNA polymerase-4
METLQEFSDTVEVVGLDEAYIDLSGSPVPQSRAREIKRKVTEATRLVCSIGLAPNKLMAKIASDLDKPDGLFTLSEQNWLEAVGEKPAAILPGVGPRTFERLGEIGIETVAELAGAEEALLVERFGPKHGRGLRARGNGIGATSLSTERRRKSESRETTFPYDVEDRDELRATLDRLADSVCSSMESHERRGRTVTMKIRLRPFRTFTRSRTLSEPTRDPEVVKGVAGQLLEHFELDAPVRLIGVGLANLEAENEPSDPAGASGEESEAGSLTLDV